ncbi:NAD-dependent epimerase/dehydratase family protein [Flavobacterium sp. EDS]|uniref:NAD-dependent epimerase/dehydratase family protein n=1 Tax=Flavobacterium sp. EDS TaxID=2897328 RepID=UPI001E2A181F|nr:NAD-dependent epimerase/dehydratase family protein [Flavobacterium sp. EDS]
MTGYNGFLGKSILKGLRDKSEFLTLSRSSGDYKVSLEKEIPNFKQNFKLVIHAAGKAHSIPKTGAEKKEFYDVNVLGTLNLLKGLEKCGLPKEFVFISSVSVYGLEIGNNISEEHSLLARDSYGLSKIEAERVVKKWCGDNQVVCTILRLPLLVGENPPGNLGAMVKAINRGYYFNIGGGVAKKSMVLAKDVASFIPIVAPIGGIYNLTDGVHPSFSELSLEISKSKKEQFSLPLPIAKLIAKIGDFLGTKAPINSLKLKKITSDLVFDDSKARGLLNWKPESVLDYLKRENLV